MSYWSEILYFSIFGAALLLSIIGLWFTAILPGTDRWSRHFFLCYYVVFLLCCFSGLIEMAFYHYPVPGAALYGIILLESLLLSLPLPMLTVFLLHCCGESTRSGRLLYTVLSLLAVFFIILASSLFTRNFFYVTPDRHFHRGTLYPLCLLPVIAILLCNLRGTINRRKQLSRKVFLAFLVSILSITAAMFLQLFIDFFSVVDISYVLSALTMYSLILSDQIEQDLLHQQEIARQRASVMVLQMRPHFIYNTLISIYSLCRIDPPKARQVTMDFTNYLRSNFNAIVSDSPISFSTELDHTRAYLAVEQAQYDDMLEVDYDTPFIRFRIPPLTLQPIVENAVKHGMDPDADPLRISILTRHTDSGTEVIVTDSGPGFDPSGKARRHATLENIRQRLEMMCGGHLTITPGDAGGTVVTITIPDDDPDIRKKQP